MADFPHKYINVRKGQLFLQADHHFTTQQWGLDTGSASWETHRLTPENQWPKRGDSAAGLGLGYAKMYITDLDPVFLDCGLIRLDATFKGSKLNQSGVWKERILPDCEVCMFSLPSIPSVGASTTNNIVAPVPKPRVTREFLTTTKPTWGGVSQPAAAAFLPTGGNLPGFSISFIPDPSQPQTINYRTGWILDSRQWEDIASKVWAVREVYNYYWNLAV